MTAILVDMGFEPVADEGEVPMRDFAFPVGVVVGKFFEELSGIEVAECVGGEVAHASHRPVDVLEAAEGVIRRCDAEELLHFLIPGGGDVFDFEGSFHEHFFNFKPEDDMEGIGDFIGLDADEGGDNCIDGGIKLIEGGIV